MTVKDLNKKQIHQLKEHILCEKIANVTYGELVNADSLVSDLEVEERFGGVVFTPEDFGIEEEDNKEIKIKIYPIYGAVFYVTISKIIYDKDCVDEWIEGHLKNVDFWEYA